MGSSAASDLETRSPPRGGGAEKVAFFAAKLLVTGSCFWYVSRQVDLSQALSAIPSLDVGWAALAIVLAMLQIPLLGLRWRNVVDGLAARGARMTRSAMIAATAIGTFFAQVLPSVAGEGVRAWLLVRLGCGWRNAVTSVVIDRATGVGLLVALAFVILLLPSGFTALGGYRELVLCRLRRAAPCRRARSAAGAEARPAACAMAIFPLARDAGRRRPSRSAGAERPR